MEYRRFGKTNLSLSVFSIGTMRCLSSFTNFESTIAAALELGVNHIETASSYGDSEIYLGKTIKALTRYRRAELFITTKFLPTSDRRQMAQWIDQSLRNLQTDYLDGVAIHGLNTWEHFRQIQDEEGGIQALIQAKRQGKIRHLGFSSHGSLELILTTLKTQLFEFINLHYYYFFQRNSPAVAVAHDQDLGIFIISPADKGGQLHTPSATLQHLCEPLTPLGFNYRFLLSNPWITTLSIGPANPQELASIIPFMDQVEPLSDLELTIESRLNLHLRQVLQSDRCSQCYECLPCPEQIPIPELLRLRNLAVAYDLENYGKYRYQMIENAGHWFPGRRGDRCTECGDCLPRCPEQLNIPQLLQDTHDRLQGSPRRRLWQN